MPAPRATDAPTREGVTVHRTEGVTLPARRKSWSWAGYTARWNSDPMTVWERTADERGHARITCWRVSGPWMAADTIRRIHERGGQIVVVWDDSGDPCADHYGNPADRIPPEFRDRPEGI